MIRREYRGNGITFDVYVCHECKTEDYASAYGVQCENAINSTPPRGWTHEDIRDRPIVGRIIRIHYCPRCSVALEYRKELKA